MTAYLKETTSLEKLISKETESDLLKLGIYQIGGAVIGILLILWSIIRGAEFSGLVIVLYLIILLFFGYSFYCGALCIKCDKNALQRSLVNQILQLIGFAMFGYAFKYTAGIYLILGIDFTESFKLTFGAGISQVDFKFNIDSDTRLIDFNLVAIGLVYWIDKIMKRVKLEREIRQVAEIGEI